MHIWSVTSGERKCSKAQASDSMAAFSLTLNTSTRSCSASLCRLIIPLARVSPFSVNSYAFSPALERYPCSTSFSICLLSADPVWLVSMIFEADLVSPASISIHTLSSISSGGS